MDRHTTRKPTKWQSDSSTTLYDNELRNVSLEDILRVKLSGIPGTDMSNENCRHSLELELSESLGRMISSTRNSATVVDVTVVRPEQQPTELSTVKTSDIRKLIASIDKQKENRKKMIEECKSILLTGDKKNKKKEERKKVRSEEYSRSRDNSRGCRKSKTVPANDASVHKPVKDQIGDHTNVPVTRSTRKLQKQLKLRAYEVSRGLEEHYKKPKAEEFVQDNQQVYATMKTWDDLRKHFTCLNEGNRDAEDGKRQPCFCQHCGMVDVLIESQKHPVLCSTSEEDHLEKQDLIGKYRKNRDKSKRRQHTKSRDFTPLEVITEKIVDNSNYEVMIGELRERIKSLEGKMKEYEDKTVSREYLKKVMNKIISYMNPTKNLTAYEHNRNVSTQKGSARTKPTRNVEVLVNPVLVSNDQDDSVSAVCFWKWGSEIIKPGVDLKDKIVELLEDRSPKSRHLKEVATSSEKIVSLSDALKEVDKKRQTALNAVEESPFKKFLELMSKQVKSGDEKASKTVGDKRAVDDNTFKKSIQSQKKTVEKVAEALRNSKYVKTDRGERSSSDQTIPGRRVSSKFNTKRSKHSDPKGKSKKDEGSRKHRDEKVRITYMNPKAKYWERDESCSVFGDCSKQASKISELNKREKKLLDNISTENHSKFWLTLWEQARKFGKSKQDKVTIQVPSKLGSDGKPTGDTVKEVQLTIGELEEVAKRFGRNVEGFTETTSSSPASRTILVEKRRRNSSKNKNS